MDAMALGDEMESDSPRGAFTADELIQSLRDSFFLVDRFGSFVYACPLLAEMMGERPENMTGKNLTELLPSGHINHFLMLREKLLSGEPAQFEWELTGENGSPSYMRISLHPWRRGDEMVGAVGLVWDITDAVIGERELEKKALLLRLQMDVLEGLQEAGGITEMLHVIVDRACEALGMDAACLASIYPSERGWLARQIIDTRWPLGQPLIAQWKELPGRALESLLENMEIFSIEEGEGPVEWIAPFQPRLTLVTPMVASPRGAFVLIMISREEREWHQFEREFLRGLVSIGGQALQRAEIVGSLRQSEESYVNLAESVNEAIAIVESGKLVFANRAMAKLMGYVDAGEMKGMSLEDFVLPESLRELRLRSLGKELAPGKVRIHLRRPQGQEFLTDVEITHLPYGSRRAYQVMIKGIEGFENEGDSDPDFIARLSHDFRTPLVSVTGFADILERLVAEGNNARVEECIDGIKRGVKRLNRMVDNMLVLARTQVVSKDNWGNPSRVIQDVLEDLRQDIREAGVEVVIQDDMPPVLVSESELQEIFQNLLSNALRAVRGVASPRVAVSHEASEDHHVFSIEDNGVGIPEKYHESVFKPLFRLVKGEEGSGLGLSIVRQIVRAHGGDIWVKSSVGVGTAFYFSLPIN